MSTESPVYVAVIKGNGGGIIREEHFPTLRQAEAFARRASRWRMARGGHGGYLGSDYWGVGVVLVSERWLAAEGYVIAGRIVGRYYKGERETT